MTVVGAAPGITFKPHLVKPNRAVDFSDFRMEVGSYKSVRLTDKVFFLLSHPVVLNTRWEMLSDILISGLNAFVPYDGVIRAAIGW
jgi:hypothetical protein